MKLFNTSTFIRYSLWFLFIGGIPLITLGQGEQPQKEYYGQEAAQLIPGARYVLEGLNTNFPAYVTFDEDKTIPYSEFFKWFRETLQVEADIDFPLVNQEQDELGFTHYHFAQTKKGIEVSMGGYHVQVKNGKVVSFNGHAYEVPNMSPAPSLSEAQALRQALSYVGADSYMWENPFWESEIKRRSKDENATYYPKGELYWSRSVGVSGPGSFSLAYRFDIYTEGGNSSQIVMVDALSGNILNSFPLESNCSSASITDIYNGTNQTIYTEKYTANDYRLKDDCTAATIRIRDWNSNTTAANPVEIENTTNTWNGNNNERFGATVLWHTKESYNYFKSVHGRNSYNHADGDVEGYINAVFGCTPPPNPCYYTDNASMSFSGGTMKVGFGSGGTLNDTWGALDIIGHEYTHAVTGSSSALKYEGESGALNESFSDIFGDAIERRTTGSNDWLVGNDRASGAIRSLANPNLGNDPDTYQGTFWKNTHPDSSDNGGVHTNSGVQNYWFYLLGVGNGTVTTGTNDNGNAYSVTGIGFNTARAIAYRNLVVKLKNNVNLTNSNYADARAGAIGAAEDLYGACSNEVLQVKNAWYAVGVGTPGGPTFNTTNTSPAVCSGVPFSIDLQSYRTANFVTPIYRWFASYPAGMSGGNGDCLGNGCGTSINETLFNNTTGPLSVTYTLTRVEYDGCLLPSFSITKVINPRPAANGNTETGVCSGDPFSIDLQSKVFNNVPSNFTWTVNYNGLTNGNGPGSGDFINETLIKTTFSPQQNAVYTVTPSSEQGSCQGNTFAVTQPVYPQPDIDDLPDTVTCDSLLFPPITGTTLSGNQAYYTGPNKTGTKYLPGDILYASELTVLTIYMYDESGTVPNCYDQESFQLTIRGCAKLGDYTWQDLDEDGIQDPGEPPAAGMNVTLYRGLNNPYKQTTTDANGFYLFDSLFMDNNYYLRFTNLPQFHVFSPYEVGPNDSIDSDANPLGYTVIITLKSAEEDSTWDAGYYELLGEIGDRVWNDLNMNGQQNAGEPGVGGVQVDLYDCNNNFVAGTTTDGNGNYLFADLSSDDYYVKFSNLPPGYVFTTKNNAGATEDSDVNPNGQTDCNNLGPGQTDYNRDAGIYLKLSSVGDFVWCDDNRNGCQDLGESGIKGVTVTLYDENGQAMASTTTNSFGRYRFGGLFPGNYRVGFSNLPAGFIFAGGGGCTPTTDSDADPVTGKTPLFALGAGQDRTDQDAGIFLPSGGIGDIVWNDLNHDGIRNIGEPGVAGISVYLYSSTFQALGFTSTDNNGYYNFTGLSAGGYYVAFGGLPQGWVFSPKGQGGNANFDSDVNAQGATSLITLATGSGRSDIDAGIYNPNANPPIVSGKVLLQGAYDSNTGLMRHDLNTQGLLPLLQPYMQAPWNYAGLAAVNNLPADVVDWVMIEFRSAADATQVIDQQVALLKDNGDIVGLDGFSPVYSPNLGGVSSAYLVVKHRNHLPVMSAAPVSITSNGFVYDFSGSLSALYTNNGLPNTPGVEVTAGGKVMMTQGDKNSDELVNSLDLGGIMSQYFRTGLNQGDVNLDGVTNSLDIGKAMQSYFRSSHVPR